mgnify:CR=1 FL=1
MVAFTGSTAVGRHIMASCAGSLKRLVLELGGKDPMVVFGDADLDKAAEIAVQFSLFNCGQVCCAVERVYVAQSVAADFEKQGVARARSYVAGDGLEPSRGALASTGAPTFQAPVEAPAEAPAAATPAAAKRPPAAALKRPAASAAPWAERAGVPEVREERIREGVRIDRDSG